MSDNIRELVSKARDGNADAFGELYSIYSKEMYCYACTVVGNADLAQDAVSEAVLAAFKEIKNLRNEDSFKGWLFRILNAACKKQYHIAHDNLQLNEDVEIDTGESNSGGIEQLELSMELEEALKVLSHEEKEIVLLRVVSEYGSKEIAEALGIPDATVRSKLKRALEKMRKHMSPQ